MIWELFLASQWICLIFFVGINFSYLFFCILSFANLPKKVQNHTLLRELPQPHTDFEIPISLIVTAYNEEAVIVESVRSLLQIDYSKYEIVVVNDGSKDSTLEILKEEFDLISLPIAVRQRLPHKPIRGFYQSAIYPNLRVVDKENGGCKADASNTGIDASIYPLITPLDADTILEKDTFKLLVQPFLSDPNTILAGGSIRVVNGCKVSKGFLEEIGLPYKNFYVLFQILEYMRAFLFVRVGWEVMNALPIVSGAMGLFHKESLVELGGFSRKTHAEDLEITLRLHLHHISTGKPYKIAYVPDATCYTEVPDTYKSLRKQRVRWHQGFTECLWFNRKLLFHPKGKVLSWVSIPFQIIFEALSPLIEIGGYFSTILFWYFGVLSYEGALALLCLAVGVGILLTFVALVLEEAMFRKYPKMSHLFILFVAAVIENLGYRQINAWWRFTGLIYWAIGYEESRAMARSGAWQKSAAPKNSSQNEEDNSIIKGGQGSHT